MTAKEFTDYIKLLGLTSKQVASLLQVSYGAVCKWRTGERRISPSMELLIRLMLEGRGK